MSERCGIDQRRAGFPQRERAGMQSGPSGEDIIDDDITGRRIDGLSVDDDERTGDILSAFLSSEAGLRDGLILLAEHKLGPAPWDVRCEKGRDAFRLIVTAVA